METMSELEAEWARRLAEARARATAAGRGDVAEYLTLRATNDLQRNFGIAWLLEAFHEAASAANRTGARISVTRHSDAAHRFRVGHSTMAGDCLTLRAGVRVLTVEAGWPRTPADGIVRGGGLACARLSHLGQSDANEELLLVPAATMSDKPESAPGWFTLNADGARMAFDHTRVNIHLTRLLG